MPLVMPITKPATAGTAPGAQGRSVLAAYHNLTQPKNWWQGMTSMLPGWTPKAGSSLTPPWSPTPISTPQDWALTYGHGFKQMPNASPVTLPAAAAPTAMQSLINANRNLWRPFSRQRGV